MDLLWLQSFYILVYLIDLHFVQLIQSISFVKSLVKLCAQLLDLGLEIGLLLLQRLQGHANLLMLSLLLLLRGFILKGKNKIRTSK